MTAYLTRTIRQAGIVLAFAVSFSALSATSSFAYSSEAQQMCTGDAFRLCSDEIPNISKITACMMKKRASLSTGCRAVMDRDLAQKSEQGRRAVIFARHSGLVRRTRPVHSQSGFRVRCCACPGMTARLSQKTLRRRFERIRTRLDHDRVGVTT